MTFLELYIVGMTMVTILSYLTQSIFNEEEY